MALLKRMNRATCLLRDQNQQIFPADEKGWQHVSQAASANSIAECCQIGRRSPTILLQIIHGSKIRMPFRPIITTEIFPFCVRNMEWVNVMELAITKD
jgi:hypothetical protein